MLRHQAVAVQTQPVLLHRVPQGRDELPPIGIVAEGSATFVAASGDVIHRSRIFESDRARHAPALFPPDSPCQASREV